MESVKFEINHQLKVSSFDTLDAIASVIAPGVAQTPLILHNWYPLN